MPFLSLAFAADVELEAPLPVQVKLWPGSRQGLSADETLSQAGAGQDT